MITLILSVLAANTIQADSDDPVSGVQTVLEGEHILALVPVEAVGRLRERVARLDEIFAFMCEEAGWTPGKKLVVNIVDEYDYLQGLATPVPRPAVELGLSPGSDSNFLVASERRLELVAIHEFTHILNMEPNFGFRAVMEHIFGRVVPNDPLSLLIFYLSFPSQGTMPRFWLEGTAQWAETKYSPPDSIWGGRGRDSGTHMIWRMDAAAGEIPDKEDWRLSYTRWPYGSRPYNYGLAYTRYLEGAYGDRASIWEIALNQAKSWPFMFDSGAGRTLGKTHAPLIEEAMAALEEEQAENLQKLRREPLTPIKRLTPEDHIFAAPAWTNDGRLLAGSYRPYAGFQRYVYIDEKGRMSETDLTSYDMAATRRSPGGSLVTADFVLTAKGRYRTRVTIIRPNEKPFRVGLRLVHPDLAEGVFDGEDALAAIRFTDGGGHELRIYRLTGDNLEHASTVPATGLPWSPAFRPRPGGPPTEIAWVETDENLSRLVTAPLSDLNKRRVLLSIPAKIAHPCWSNDGGELYYCSDITGVSNAYRMEVSDTGAILRNRPITHTIGGVVACVPSPDGREFAIIDHDHRGPFLARIPNNPATDPTNLPKIDIAWPAPVEGSTVEKAGRFQEPPALKTPAALDEYPYNGLEHLEFVYWTPTTLATSAGGLGLAAALTDPIRNHDIKAGAGVGPVESEPVGQLYYGYYGLDRTDAMAMGYAFESTLYGKVLESDGDRFDYTETIRGGFAGFGFDLSGLEDEITAIAALGYQEKEQAGDSINYRRAGIVSDTPFEGSEHFAQLGLFYNATTFFPTSYYQEDGPILSLEYRYSGHFLGGDLDRNRVLGEAGYVFSAVPQWGLQFEAKTAGGWSDGKRHLQGAFTIGGTNIDGIETPRGYTETEATGPYFGAYSAACRFPVYRPFKGFGTTPFEIRQIVLDLFFDAGLVSSDEPFGDGEWYRSAGVESTIDTRFFNIPIRPGIQVARQLDGDKDTSVKLVLRGMF